MVIIWDDAYTDGGWEEIPEQLNSSIATSVGFLVKETDHHILIASSCDGTHINGRLQIPKGMIKTLKIIKK